VTHVKINARDSNVKLLKPHPWALLEAINSILETYFISPEQYNMEVAPYTLPPKDPHIRRYSLHPAGTRAMTS